MARVAAAAALQETLRTSQFPTTHIKDKWDNDLYLIGIAYGKTVS